MSQENALARWGTIGNIILIGGGASCILVLFYFFYHYSLTGERQFTAPIGVVSYYVLPAAVATLLFVALSLERNYKINLAILLVSFGFSVCAAELFLGFSDTMSSAASPLWGSDIKKRKYEVLSLAKKFGVDFDTRSTLKVIADLKSEGVDAVPSFSPFAVLTKRADGSMGSRLYIKGAELIPLGGMSNRITVFCNETGTYLIYNSDEHGFHNPKGIWQADHIPVVAVGDSFAQGGCVPSEKNFVAMIRKRLPGTLNLGMAGDGPLTMLATLKEYLPVTKPKAVLWFYFEEGEMSHLTRERRSPLLMRYLESNFSQHLAGRQREIDQALSEFIKQEMTKELAKDREKDTTNLQITSTLMNTFRLSSLRNSLGLVMGKRTQEDDSEPVTNQDMELFRTVLAQAKASVSAEGGMLYFVNLPSWERFGNPELANKTGGQYRSQVLAMAKDLGIPIIDLEVGFRATKDPLSLFSFRRFGHYNEEGHRVVAEEVLRSIAVEN